MCNILEETPNTLQTRIAQLNTKSNQISLRPTTGLNNPQFYQHTCSYNIKSVLRTSKCIKEK